jgi:hypothetical protein
MLLRIRELVSVLRVINFQLITSSVCFEWGSDELLTFLYPRARWPLARGGAPARPGARRAGVHMAAISGPYERRSTGY